MHVYCTMYMYICMYAACMLHVRNAFLVYIYMYVYMYESIMYVGMCIVVIHY